MTAPMITSSNTFALDFEVPAHAAARTALVRSTIAKAINLSRADQRVLADIVRGDVVPLADLHRAIVAGLGVAITRKGQSMLRRADREALLALYALLPAPDGILPQVEVRKAVQTVYSPSPTEQAHRERVEQRQAETITAQAEEIRALRRQVAEQVALLQQAATAPRPVAADVAAYGFALDIMTGEQRQRVSDFRTGYRAADRG